MIKKGSIQGRTWSHFQIVNNCVFASATGVAFLIGYLRQIGFNEIQIAMYGTIIGLAGFFNILGAWVSISSGNLKKVYLTLATLSILCFFAGITISYFSNPSSGNIMPLVILGFFFFWQVFTYMSVPALLSWLNNITVASDWGNFFSTRMIVSDISIFVTSFLAGILLGGTPGTSRFFIIFLASMLFGFLGVYFMSKTPGAVLENRAVSAKSFFRIFRDAFKSRVILYLLLLIFFRSFAYGLIMPFQPVFLLEKLKLDYTMIAVMINMSLIFAIFTYKFWARIQYRFGNYTGLKWCEILSIFTPFLWMLASQNNILVIYPAFALVGFSGYSGAAGAGYYTSCIGMIFEHSREDQKPIYTSLFFFSAGLASTIAPAIGGFLLKHFNANPLHAPLLNMEIDGYRLLFAAAGIIMILTLILLPFIKASTGGATANKNGKQP